MFLALADIMGRSQPHKRARALASAARTSLRFLGAYAEALQWLKEANELFPRRWTIEFNLASWYLWEKNPERDPEQGRAWLEKCWQDCKKPAELQRLIDQDLIMRGLCQPAGGVASPQA